MSTDLKSEKVTVDVSTAQVVYTQSFASNLTSKSTTNYNTIYGERQIEETILNENVELASNFKTRHVHMMAIASSIGTGLIIGSGTALRRGGPASLFIAYSFCGSLLMCVLLSLGEMAAFSPMDKAFSGYTARYVDRALGFAAGWNYFFNYAITLPAELSALGVVIQFWRDDLNVGIFITVFYVLFLPINWFNVKYFGEAEYWCAFYKLIVLSICFLTCLDIACGGSPTHKTVGFQYWHEHAFMEYLVDGNTGRFLGFWACLIQSVFSYNGSEAVGIVFGESPNPKETIPKATINSLFRICFFYIFGVFILGLAISPVNKTLISASRSNASSSPFVIAFQTVGIRVLPSFFNASLLIFIGSAGVSCVYLGSRTLYGLSRDGFAPKIFLKLNRHGNPFYGSVFTSLFGLLAYMNCKEASSTIFGYFSSAVSVFGLLNWINILLSYNAYYNATVYQKIDRSEIPYRAWGQPYLAYFALLIVCIITFFNGYNAFVIEFDYKQFLTSYVGIFVYLIMIFGYKFYYKTKMITKETAILKTYIV